MAQPCPPATFVAGFTPGGMFWLGPLTLGMKCEDLSPEQMATRSVPPSSRSLLGPVRHMARVEHTWFQRSLRGDRDTPRPFWSPDDDLDFTGAVADPAVVDRAFAVWQAHIAAADEWLDGQVDLGAVVLTPRGEPTSVRDVLIHMIEEYTRHCGHADFHPNRSPAEPGPNHLPAGQLVRVSWYGRTRWPGRSTT